MSMTPLHLRDLPNVHGYKFVGITRDGRRVPCAVEQDPVTRMHRITGANFRDLTGWVRA